MGRPERAQQDRRQGDGRERERRRRARRAVGRRGRQEGGQEQLHPPLAGGRVPSKCVSSLSSSPPSPSRPSSADLDGAPPRTDPERYYGFSRFAVTLNETTQLEEGLVAPTDSRLRPDQLAFERGDIDEAERIKALVCVSLPLQPLSLLLERILLTLRNGVRSEEKQRTKRKAGRAAEPRWFKKAGENGWEYGGEYCASSSLCYKFSRSSGTLADPALSPSPAVEAREKKQLEDPDIFC